MNSVMTEAPIALAVMGRSPVLGQAKKRLAASIGDEAALRVYQWLLQRTLTICKQSGLPVYFFATDCNSPELEPFLSDLSDGTEFPCLPQQGNDLGERMANAMAYVHQYAAQVVLIGTDCPCLSIADLFALAGGCTSGVAIKPAEDGGYVAIASGNAALWRQNPLPGVAWGTASVCRQSCDRLRDKGQEVTMLASAWDLDTLDDLKRNGMFKEYYE